MKTDSNSFKTSLWRFFTSLKLTIFLLMGLAAVSIIGTIIPQGTPPPAEYIQTISQTRFQLYSRLGFFDMYHSWWFILLLCLLTTNLVACTLRRLPHDWKAMTDPTPTLDEGTEKTLPFSRSWKVEGSAAELKRAAVDIIKAGFAEPIVTKVDNEYHLFAQTGRYSRLGVHLLHAGIVVVFIGAALSSILGFKGFVWLEEGETATAVTSSSGMTVDLGFSVRCDSFSVAYYDNGAPREYRSVLSVIENGRTVIEKRPLIVNGPLTYKGITFYQSGYGPAGPAVFRLSSRDRKSGSVTRFSIREGETVVLPDGQALRIIAYTRDISRHIPRLSGPALRLEIVSRDGRSRELLLVANHPYLYDTRDDRILNLERIDQKWRTGLQVARDPGVGVVWAGCILLVGGLFMAFFFSHSRIWVRIGGGRITVAGSTGRRRDAFRRFFEALAEQLRRM